MGVNVSFRDVDEQKLRNFKSIAVSQGMNFGEALNRALDLFMNSFKVKQKKRFNLTNFKPSDWGPGTEKSSSEIDEVLYGWKR